MSSQYEQNGKRGTAVYSSSDRRQTSSSSDGIREFSAASTARIPQPSNGVGLGSKHAHFTSERGVRNDTTRRSVTPPPLSRNPNKEASRPPDRSNIPPNTQQRRVPITSHGRDTNSRNYHSIPVQPMRPLPSINPIQPARRSPPRTRPSPVKTSDTRTRTRPARADDTASSRPASGKDIDRKIKIPKVFDLFFDVPHPAASKESEPARMIEPPDVHNQVILSELYEPSAISRLARFAFPEHDDQKLATNLSTQPTGHRINVEKFFGGRDKNSNLNKLDIYVLGFRSERHTFAIVLSDGITKLYGHVLRYLPTHLHAKARADVGRRGVRAMILLTQAPGGDQFYTAVLRSTEAVLLQGDAIAKPLDHSGRERAIRFLHGLYRRHVKKVTETIFQLSKGGNGGPPMNPDNLGDTFLNLPAVEYDIKSGAFIRDRTLPGDFVKFSIPQSLQAGFQMGQSPDDFDAPILPLLRCLGPENCMRLISALMCERKIILVSADSVHLSTCVRGASSLLAQGHLAWQHNQVPVLPPHMLSCLAVKRPYLVGLLDEHLEYLESLRNLTDVLCIHLDRNLIRTFGMANAGKLLPDIMSKDAQKSGSGFLFSDMEQILKAEKRIWGALEAKLPEKEKEEKVVSTTPTVPKPVKRKKGKGELGRIETDIAHLFGKVMRGDALDDDDDITVESSVIDDTSEHARVDHTSGHVPRTSEQSDHESRTLTTFEVCENERGEEGLRAALAFFFLMTHGDLGTLLTEQDGIFLLDRKKYLLTRKKAGNKEDSTMFALYRQFSGTAMLEQYVGLRTEEFDRSRFPVMTRHKSLFSLCERHLRTRKVEFTSPNIRMLISKTTLHMPIHAMVERSEIVRARALTLTSAQPFEGNISSALSSLMQDCYQCDSALPQVIAVIWSRLDDRRSNGWKHPLLGLHLLKNLLLHGPITALSHAIDGADKVRRLRFYSTAKSAENNKEVQDSSQFVWTLMVDRPRLLLRRQQVISGRAKLNELPHGARWGDYLIKKIPFNTVFREYHSLLRPKVTFTPCFMKENRIGAGGQDPRQMEMLKMSVRPFVSDETGSVTPSLRAASGTDDQRPKLSPTTGSRMSVQGMSMSNGVQTGQRPSEIPLNRRPPQSSLRSNEERVSSIQSSTPNRSPGRERNSNKATISTQPARNSHVNGEHRQYNPAAPPEYHRRVHSS